MFFNHYSPKIIIMKKQFSKLTLGLLGLTLTVFIFSSCQKNTDMPALDESSIESTKKGAPAPSDVTITEIAISAGFTELVDALTYVDTALNAGLIDELSGTKQYTVFAPNNQAFEDLYAALGVSAITDLPAPLVLDVLLYHVTNGRRASNSVVPKKGTKIIQTLAKKSFSVNPMAEITAIGSSAQIIDPDYSASNGIVHIIDGVLLPIE